MSSILEKIREQVEQRANDLCEYCQTAKAIVLNMHVDHIVPLSANGSDDLDNLCLACTNCNQSKAYFQTGIDPETDAEFPLFNPRLQNWDEHFQWHENYTIIIGLTSIGRATISRLKMNKPDIVQARSRWVKVGWHPPKT